MRAVNTAAEGGAVLRLGLMNFVLLVLPDDQHGRQLLRRAGAWLLLNPRGLIGCGLPTGGEIEWRLTCNVRSSDLMVISVGLT
jgi:hypothetical protein